MAEYSFKLLKGTDRTLIFAFFEKNENGEKTVYDLTGYQGAMQIRTAYSSQKAVDTFTTSNGKMTIDAKEGRVSIIFDHTSTEAYPVGSLVYDIELTNSEGERTRPIQGKIKVLAEVTKIAPTDSD